MLAASALLAASGLPTAGFDDLVATTLVAVKERDLIPFFHGVVALEPVGDYALLRSLAVAAPSRGEGLGTALTEAALGLARERRVAALYLLTETADTFFPRFGFHAVDRDQVPEPVRATVEFTSACPASATAMELTLR